MLALIGLFFGQSIPKNFNYMKGLRGFLDGLVASRSVVETSTLAHPILQSTPGVDTTVFTATTIVVALTEATVASISLTPVIDAELMSTLIDIDVAIVHLASKSILTASTTAPARAIPKKDLSLTISKPKESPNTEAEKNIVVVALGLRWSLVIPSTVAQFADESSKNPAL